MAGTARSADQNTLRNIQAPSPAATRQLPPVVRSVKFAKVVVHLKPEPWASVRAIYDGQPEHLVTWKEGAQEVKPSVVSEIFNDEVKQAGGKTDADSVFSPEQADLLVGVGITEMLGRFCQGGCGYILSDQRWHGTVRMIARWELYSPLDRRVIATVETSGGFATAKTGIEGEPDRIINEAFRDNVRRLIASEEFRRAVSTPIGAAESVANASASTSKPPPTILAASKLQPSLSQASNSVAVIFANDGSGSGFLVADDGYLITNHHVVGTSKYVKLKWPDGTETLGEVIRTDPRRDVALVKTESKSRPALGLRQTAVQQGETVFAIGSPLGDRFQNTMTKGIVSAVRTESGQTFIQSDVVVNHGSSGGPLLDEKGRVIGLTVSGQAPNGDPIGLNFFIPIGDALKALSLTPATG
jgi:S1-C subfamily serine protease